MTYKEKLIEFTNTKKDLINLYSKINYINQKDTKEIKSWSEKECKIVYKYMYKYIIKSVNEFISTGIDNSITCPWCIYNFRVKIYDDCNNCNYGKRNGICNKSDSTYQKIVAKNGFAFIRKEDYLNIINKIGD